MKIAVLSDIHSNVFALEAVIDDAKKRGVGQMLNLGDIFYGPIAPRATYELLKEHDFVTIRGNQDRQIYEASQEEMDTDPTMRFILNDLGEEPIFWMKSLPFDNQLNDEIYMCHHCCPGNYIMISICYKYTTASTCNFGKKSTALKSSLST